MTAETNTPIY